LSPTPAQRSSHRQQTHTPAAAFHFRSTMVGEPVTTSSTPSERRYVTQVRHAGTSQVAPPCDPWRQSAQQSCSWVP
jgi:hypothetical protein